MCFLACRFWWETCLFTSIGRSRLTLSPANMDSKTCHLYQVSFALHSLFDQSLQSWMEVTSRVLDMLEGPLKGEISQCYLHPIGIEVKVLYVTGCSVCLLSTSVNSRKSCCARELTPCSPLCHVFCLDRLMIWQWLSFSNHGLEYWFTGFLLVIPAWDYF